jgi:hypothetical protein
LFVDLKGRILSRQTLIIKFNKLKEIFFSEIIGKKTNIDTLRLVVNGNPNLFNAFSETQITQINKKLNTGNFFTKNYFKGGKHTQNKIKSRKYTLKKYKYRKYLHKKNKSRKYNQSKKNKTKSKYVSYISKKNKTKKHMKKKHRNTKRI